MTPVYVIVDSTQCDALARPAYPRADASYALPTSHERDSLHLGDEIRKLNDR